MSESIFNKQNMGGINTSKIGNQDVVATIYSVEVMFNDWIIDIGENENENFSICCEQHDDLEVINNEIEVFIQVKSGSFKLEDILDNFLNKELNNNKMHYYLISAFNLNKENKSFAEYLSKYHEYRCTKFRNEEDVDKQRNNLLNQFDLLKYLRIIDKLFIDERPFRQNDKDCKAIFSHILRQNYGIHDENDKKIDTLFDELCHKFNNLRTKGSSITGIEVSRIINDHIVKNTAVRGYTLALQYKKENNYYIPNIDSKKIVSSINNGFLKAIKTMHREWVKKYFKYFILKFLGNYEICDKCGHPLMANFNGICKGGLACPDCGSQPFLTLVSFCECGNYEIICSQPELDDISIYNYVTKFFRIKQNRKCKKCGKNLFDEYYDMRISVVPYPVDFKLYIEKYC